MLQFRVLTKNWFIYALRDPRQQAIRYVGVVRDRKREQGLKAVAERLKEHLQDARRRANRPVCKWLKRLLDDGFEPILEVIDQGSGDGWEEAEIRHIADHRANGHRLLNLMPGGARREYGEAKGLTQEKLSKAARGRRASAAERMRRCSSMRKLKRIKVSAPTQAHAGVSRVLCRTAKMLTAGAVIETPADLYDFSRALNRSKLSSIVDLFESHEDFMASARAFCWEPPVGQFRIPNYPRQIMEVGSETDRALIRFFNEGYDLKTIAQRLNTEGFKTKGKAGINSKLSTDQQTEALRLCSIANTTSRRQFTQIGAQFGVSYTTIERLYRGQKADPESSSRAWTLTSVHRRAKQLNLDTSHQTRITADLAARFKAAYDAVGALSRSPLKRGLARVLKTSTPHVVEIIKAALRKADAQAATLPHVINDLSDESAHDPHNADGSVRR